jgi:hypothetical protein
MFECAGSAWAGGEIFLLKRVDRAAFAKKSVYYGLEDGAGPVASTFAGRDFHSLPFSFLQLSKFPQSPAGRSTRIKLGADGELGILRGRYIFQ